MAALGLGLAGCRPRPPAAPPPSILLVVVDTLRADRVGGPASRTPRIDRWSERAAVFPAARTPAPFTMPAVASLMTGAWPDRSGITGHEPGMGLQGWNGATLAESARAAGMTTSAVVANPWLARTGTAFDRGFDAYVRAYRRGAPAEASDAAAVTDAAVRELDRLRERRFLLWVHYFDPHMPYAPPATWARAAGAGNAADSRVMREYAEGRRALAQLYRGSDYGREEVEEARRLYDGEVRYVDDQVGRLLDHLQQLGRDRDTVVVFVSDHGEALGEHGLYFGHDFTLYDELTRVPLRLGGPGIASGVRDHDVSLVDVAPTLCRLAALGCTASPDGVDLLAPPRPRTLFAAGTTRRARGPAFDRLLVDGVEGRWTAAWSKGLALLRLPVPSRDATDGSGDAAAPESRRQDGGGAAAREEAGGQPNDVATPSGPSGNTASAPHIPALLELYDTHEDPAQQHDLAADARLRDARSAMEEELAAWTRAMDAARPVAVTHPRRGDERHLRALGYLQ